MRRTVVIGTAWGVLCALVNSVPVATTLAQMAVPWIWVAALVGYRLANSTRRASLLGAIALLAANVAYFALTAIGNVVVGSSPTDGVRFFVLWSAVGLIIGPFAGTIGLWMKHPDRAPLGVALLATVSVAEPVALWAHIDHLDAHIAYVTVALAGLALPWIRFRTQLGKAAISLGVIFLLGYPVAVVLEASLIGLGQISPPLRLV